MIALENAADILSGSFPGEGRMNAVGHGAMEQSWRAIGLTVHSLLGLMRGEELA